MSEQLQAYRLCWSSFDNSSTFVSLNIINKKEKEFFVFHLWPLNLSYMLILWHIIIIIFFDINPLDFKYRSTLP